MRFPQRGNILFLILLAVVLFAALAYAVTSSLRGGGRDASSENDRAYAATLTQYASLIESTVNRMMLTGNVKVEQLDFQAVGYSSEGANVNCTATGSTACKVFHPDGGGIQAQRVPAKMRDMNITDNIVDGEVTNGFFLISVKDIGTTLPDIVMFQRGVKKKHL